MGNCNDDEIDIEEEKGDKKKRYINPAWLKRKRCELNLSKIYYCCYEYS